MPVKATELEARIAKAWGRCGVTVRGMWLTIRTVIESEPNNERALFMEHAMPLDIAQAALMGRCKIATASRSIDKLVQVGLLSVNDKGEYFSPWLHSLFVARKSGAKRVAKLRQKRGSVDSGALRNDPDGRYISQCNTDVTPPPSPLVSPPITPSSLPPPVLYIPGEKSVVTETHRTAAIEQFERWSKLVRGKSLNEFANEIRLVEDLLESVSDSAPVIQGGQPVRRHVLVPLVAQMLADARSKFPNMPYAVQSVRGRLEEWALNGMPGPKPQGGRPPPGQPQKRYPSRIVPS